MDPKNNQPIDPKNPVASLLQQEVEGYIPINTKAKPSSTNPTLGKLDPKNKEDSRILKTYESDVARVMQQKNGSVVKIAAQEQERKDFRRAQSEVQKEEPQPIAPLQKKPVSQSSAPKKPTPVSSFSQPIAYPVTVAQNQNPVTVAPQNIPQKTFYKPIEQTYIEDPEKVPRKKTGIILTSIILIIIGIASVPTVQFFLNQKKVEVPVVIDKKTIPYDKKITLDVTHLDKDQLAQQLQGTVSASSGAGTVNYIAFTKQVTDENKKVQTVDLDVASFLNLATPSIPPALARSFEPDYMYGIYTSSNNQTLPFLIFRTNAYEQTYAGMLRFEETMNAEVGTLMKSPSLGTNKLFVDKIIQNKDVRALTDDQGNILLMYTFLDNHTVMITTSSETFKEMYTRYVAAKFVQ